MVFASILAAFLQTLSPSGLIAVGEAAGRLGAASEVCSALGYGVDQLVAEDRANRFARQAENAGWSSIEIGQIIAAGVNRERAELEFSLPLNDFPRDELLLHAASLAAKAKRFCRDLAEHHPGLITDLAKGERAIDELLRR